MNITQTYVYTIVTGPRQGRYVLTGTIEQITKILIDSFGFTLDGFLDDPTQIDEIQGHPTFHELIGPFPDGGNRFRYEDDETFVDYTLLKQASGA